MRVSMGSGRRALPGCAGGAAAVVAAGVVVHEGEDGDGDLDSCADLAEQSRLGVVPGRRAGECDVGEQVGAQLIGRAGVGVAVRVGGESISGSVPSPPSGPARSPR